MQMSAHMMQRNNADYINVSLVEVPNANCAYILTQGALRDMTYGSQPGMSRSVRSSSPVRRHVLVDGSAVFFSWTKTKPFSFSFSFCHLVKFSS